MPDPTNPRELAARLKDRAASLMLMHRAADAETAALLREAARALAEGPAPTVSADLVERLRVLEPGEDEFWLGFNRALDEVLSLPPSAGDATGPEPCAGYTKMFDELAAAVGLERPGTPAYDVTATILHRLRAAGGEQPRTVTREIPVSGAHWSGSLTATAPEGSPVEAEREEVVTGYTIPCGCTLIDDRTYPCKDHAAASSPPARPTREQVREAIEPYIVPPGELGTNDSMRRAFAAADDLLRLFDAPSAEGEG